MLLPLSIIYKIKNIELYNKFINDNADDEIKSVIEFLLKYDKINSYFYSIASIKQNETIEEKTIQAYHNIFKKQIGYIKFPFLEALSMLGSDLNFN